MKIYLSMKTLTDFRKTVETGVDPRLKGKGVLGAREARPSRFPRAQNPLSVPFQRPAS